MKGFIPLNIDAEEPNINMYHFEGSISMNLNGVQTSYDLSLPNFIQRGCVVCNCEMYAVVVYTGVDTKIILN